MGTPLIYNARVKKLKNTTFVGESLKITILDITENDSFVCPIDCTYYDRPYECELKLDLMNESLVSVLGCSTVLVKVENLLSGTFEFRTDGSHCRAVDSFGTLYKTTGAHSHSQTECLEQIFGSKFGHVRTESTTIPSNDNATFLLCFPEIPKGAKIVRLIFGGTRYLETFDIGVGEEPFETTSMTEGWKQLDSKTSEEIAEDILEFAKEKMKGKRILQHCPRFWRIYNDYSLDSGVPMFCDVRFGTELSHKISRAHSLAKIKVSEFMAKRKMEEEGELLRSFVPRIMSWIDKNGIIKLRKQDIELFLIEERVVLPRRLVTHRFKESFYNFVKSKVERTRYEEKVEKKKTLDAKEEVLGKYAWWTRADRYPIDELRDGMSHVTVEGRIIDLDEPKEVETRYGKTSLVVARLGDDTGEIELALFGEQVKKVVLEDFVRIEKGYVVKYEGRLNLTVPKNRGKIITNPEYTISFPLIRKIGRKGTRIEVTCTTCGKKFAYEYRGGQSKKYCEKCKYLPKYA